MKCDWSIKHFISFELWLKHFSSCELLLQYFISCKLLLLYYFLWILIQITHTWLKASGWLTAKSISYQNTSIPKASLAMWVIQMRYLSNSYWYLITQSSSNYNIIGPCQKDMVPRGQLARVLPSGGHLLFLAGFHRLNECIIWGMRKNKP